MTKTSLHNNQRIAKNTLLLYIRMFLMISISLYTSRVILQVLGIEDFGIYNIVGGVIVLYTFVNSALVTSTQRFLNFEIGKGNADGISRIFSISLIAQLLIALFVVLIGETVGLWFFINYIKIPEDKQVAAMWVYQFVIAGTFVNILCAPYNAAIIAYEKMSAYAYISIVEVIMKLLIVYLLIIIPYDKLETYSVLTFFVTIIVTLCYKLYCNRYFSSTRFKYQWNRTLLRELLSFSAWSLFGSGASVLNTQGLNILFNMFHGVTLNAAMGVASQVNSAVWRFSSNFQTAFQPQIVKLYAADNQTEFIKLINRSSKVSFFLLYLLSLPLIVCCDDILSLWLTEVPCYTTSFCRLILCCSILEGLAAPLWMAVQAFGKIKKYQLVISFLLLLNIPLAYLVLYQGFAPQNVLIVKVVLSGFILFFRIGYLQFTIHYFSMWNYFRKVLLPCMTIVCISFPLSYLLKVHANCIEGVILTILLSVACVLVLIYIIGLSRQEKIFIRNQIAKRF